MSETFVAQEGGDHYQAEYQHWDWVVDIGMTYLPANATKYIVRWRKKNGIADLQKAMTYLDKLILCWEKVWFCTVEPENVDALNLKFVESVGLDVNDVESSICFLLSNLYTSQDIEKIIRAKELLSQLITDAHGSAG